MKCPKCGAEYSSSDKSCSCGYAITADRPAPQLSDAEPGRTSDINSSFVLEGPFRRCAKCGSVMPLVQIQRMFINGLIPSGKRFYFQCGNCGHRLKLRSLWRNMLGLVGCLFFAIFFILFLSDPGWMLGIFALILGMYPLMLLMEIVRRVRYPLVRED